MNNTKVVNVKVSNIRPQYDDLAKWITDPNNVYMGRKGVVFINGVRFPSNDSIWANPFKIDENNSREQVIDKYRIYITEKIKKNNLIDELNKLRNKNLGCWCYPLLCHCDVIIELLEIYK